MTVKSVKSALVEEMESFIYLKNGKEATKLQAICTEYCDR